jgi:hypothetical protein
VLDNDLHIKLRQSQAKKISVSQKNVSFSETCNELICEELQNSDNSKTNGDFII